jgi:TRAP transporter TAXI family solute receptor
VVQAAEVELPKTIAWTAYSVGTAGYNQSVAIGKALKDAYNVTLRVVPGKNDISCLAPLRDGRVQFSNLGSGLFYAVEGIFDFANPEWGPQAIRLLMSANADNGLAMGTAKDANIRTPRDLKGKRVVWVRGSPAFQTNVTAFMAFGNLTWDDVIKIEAAGYTGGWRALINDKADAMTGLTVGGIIKQAAASPRGLYWLPLPFVDEKGWARLNKVAPHFTKRLATMGAGNVSKEKPLPCAGIPYPILVSYVEQDDNFAYNMTKAVSAQFASFSKAEPSAGGWADDRQNFQWVVPYHEGAIKYWKEKGLWTDEAQAHNDKLIERQKTVAKAWASMKGKDGEGFKAEWMKVRAEALTKAGLDPIWTK